MNIKTETKWLLFRFWEHSLIIKSSNKIFHTKNNHQIKFIGIVITIFYTKKLLYKKIVCLEKWTLLEVTIFLCLDKPVIFECLIEYFSFNIIYFCLFVSYCRPIAPCQQAQLLKASNINSSFRWKAFLPKYFRKHVIFHEYLTHTKLPSTYEDRYSLCNKWSLLSVAPSRLIFSLRCFVMFLNISFDRARLSFSSLLRLRTPLEW